jgi:hypothetical protein
MRCMHAQIERYLQNAYSAASYTSARPVVLDRIVHDPSIAASQTRSSITLILLHGPTSVELAMFGHAQ